MARGNAPHTKVVHKGKQDSFVVFAVGGEEVKSWRQDKSIPLVDVVAGFKVFHTHGYVSRMFFFMSSIFHPAPPLLEELADIYLFEGGLFFGGGGGAPLFSLPYPH